MCATPASLPPWADEEKQAGNAASLQSLGTEFWAWTSNGSRPPGFTE